MGFKTLIKNGIVVSVDPQRRIIKDGAVALEDDRILAVDKTAEFEGFEADQVMDAAGNVIMPGIIDTHQHHYQMLARGLADDLDIVPWCFERIYPYEATVNDEEIYNGSLLCGIEMIRHGTTTVCDGGGYRVDQIGQAMTDIGIRGMVGWMGLDKEPPTRSFPPGFPGNLPTEQTLQKAQEVVSKWHNTSDGRIRALYALRVESYISDTLYKKAHEMAVRDGVMIELHAACGPDLVDWMKETTGRTTIDHLDHLGVLSDDWLFIHMTCLTDHEVDLLAKYDCKVTHNPGASLHGCFGAFTFGKFDKMMEKGVAVGLGTDSSAENNSLDMFRAMHQVATVHKDVKQIPDLIPPEKALEMATIDGARALRWDDEIGSLEKGKKADVIIVDISHATYRPLHDFSIVPNLVYSGNGRDVTTVIIDGNLVMQDQKILTVDPEPVLQKCQAAGERIAGLLPYQIPSRWPVS